MSDESVAFVYCICDGDITDEFLEPDEEIEALLISQEDAKEILQSNHKIDTKAFLILQMFVSLELNYLNRYIERGYIEE